MGIMERRQVQGNRGMKNEIKKERKRKWGKKKMTWKLIFP
jgi:hypothetical protein